MTALDPGIHARDACGFYALRGLLGWAHVTGLTPRVLHRSMSGPPDRVVGYAAVEFGPVDGQSGEAARSGHTER